MGVKKRIMRTCLDGDDQKIQTGFVDLSGDAMDLALAGTEGLEDRLGDGKVEGS